MKFSKILLPILFCCTIVFVGFINISNFKSSYDKSIEDNKDNKQLALSKVESTYAENFEGKNNFITLNGAFANLIGKKTLNNVVKLENGYLTETVEKIDTEPLIENTVEFKKYLDEKSIPFLYVQAPYKMPTDDSYLPEGVESFANQNADNLLNGLKQNNIDTLDLREEIQKDRIDHYSLFYKTDHHWNIRGAFYGYTKVLDKISSILNTDINEDYTNINNYKSTIYENIFLGSRGKRVGPYYGGVDDFEILTPKFETNLTLEIPTKKIFKEGSFEDSLLFKENLVKDYYNTHPYRTFLKGESESVKIKNNISNNNKKIFIIKDSFTRPLSTFLALQYDEIYLYDLRHCSTDDMIFKIEEVNPDILICMYNPNQLNENMFTFLDDIN
jgi:hypothetical protein